jgi:hypothetical protein
MALLIMTIHSEDDSYSPIAVVKDDGEIITPNKRLQRALKRYSSPDEMANVLNNGQSKVTTSMPEEQAMKLLQSAKVERTSNG